MIFKGSGQLYLQKEKLLWNKCTIKYILLA